MPFDVRPGTVRLLTPVLLPHAGRRLHMEDRHTILPDFQLSPTTSGIPHQFAAVYDGHCSARGSEHAADRLHELLAEQPEIQTCQVLGRLVMVCIGGY